MDRYEFRLPDIGEGTAEAECVGWHVAVGDRVEEDQPLVDVMTDKATVEVTSPVEGTIVELRGTAGEMMRVGSVVIVFAIENAERTEDATPASAEAPVLPDKPQDAQPPAPAPSRSRVLTTPAVRQRARELGVDLTQLAGSGPNGRIRQTDLDAHLAVSRPRTQAATESQTSIHDSPDPFDEVAVIGLRRKIAERMQDTKRRIPHFSYIEEIDVTTLEHVRAALNREYEGTRPKLTILPFLIRALARVLPEFPHLNALYDDQAGIVRHHRAFHAGIATQTQKGLVVTVLRDAETKDMWSLAQEISRLSELARSGRATPRELSGSTLTISSLGAMGGLATTPVINSPEVAIIGVNKLVERPVVAGGTIAIAKVMNLSSSFDHRVVDGWDAANFIQRVRRLLEEPSLLLID